MCIWCVKKAEIFAEIGFMDCKWSSLNAPGPYILDVIHFWCQLWGAICPALRKNMCMWRVNKVEISFVEIGFMDCKLFNLNAATPHTPWCHPLFGSIMGCYFNIFENWRHGPRACVIESSLTRTQRQHAAECRTAESPPAQASDESTKQTRYVLRTSANITQK